MSACRTVLHSRLPVSVEDARHCCQTPKDTPRDTAAGCADFSPSAIRNCYVVRPFPSNSNSHCRVVVQGGSCLLGMLRKSSMPRPRIPINDSASATAISVVVYGDEIYAISMSASSLMKFRYRRYVLAI